MKPEKLDELKAANPNGIFEGEIVFADEEGKTHNVCFIYRKPSTADLESYGKSAKKNPIVANLNMIQSLIVYPESGPVIDEIREYPTAYGSFVEEALVPFFGSKVTVKSRKL